MWPPWEIRWPDIRGAPLRLRCAVVDVLEWLLDSDPAVRWQVKRDLLGAPAEEEVLSGLLEYERATGGSPRVHDVRLRGQEYLLERRMRRRLSNGEVIDPEWDLFSFPTYWHYDVLRGLDFLRSAGAGPTPAWRKRWGWCGPRPIPRAAGHSRTRTPAGCTSPWTVRRDGRAAGTP